MQRWGVPIVAGSAVAVPMRILCNLRCCYCGKGSSFLLHCHFQNGTDSAASPQSKSWHNFDWKLTICAVSAPCGKLDKGVSIFSTNQGQYTTRIHSSSRRTAADTE